MSFIETYPSVRKIKHAVQSFDYLHSNAMNSLGFIDNALGDLM